VQIGHPREHDGRAPTQPGGRPWFMRRLRGTWRLAARPTARRRRRALLFLVPLLAVALLMFPAAWLVHHVYFDRAGVPDLASFLRFEPPRPASSATFTARC